MRNIHHLKTWPAPFRDVAGGIKQYEVRKNDRDYQVDDLLMLREYDPKTHAFSGRYVRARVCHKLMAADGDFGLKDGYCVLGLDCINNFHEVTHPLE